MMRNEEKIIEMIKNIALEDDNVHAVIRTNLKPVRDYAFKYEFYFIVKDIEEYSNDNVFEKCFGDRILLYRGDNNYPEFFPDTKAHLMIFRDGVTIVINTMDKDTFISKYNGEIKHENVWMGDTYQKILDKENILMIEDRLEEKQILFSERPSKTQYLGTIDEFWWVLKSFAEYILRKELLAAMFYLNTPVRELLNRMIKWNIYLNNNVPIDMGILDSNMEQLLDEDYFSLYKKTYPASDYDSLWEAFNAVTVLWGKVGREVADKCGFVYPADTERDMLRLISELENMN